MSSSLHSSEKYTQCGKNILYSFRLFASFIALYIRSNDGEFFSNSLAFIYFFNYEPSHEGSVNTIPLNSLIKDLMYSQF